MPRANKIEQKTSQSSVDVPDPFEKEPPIDEDEELIADQALEDSLAALDEQLGANVGDASVKIYRQDQRTKKLIYLYAQTVPEFLECGMDNIRDQYGSGDYAVRVYVNGRVHTHRIVSVEAARVAGMQREINAVRALPANDGVVAAVMAPVAQMMEQIQATMRQLAEQNRPQSLADRLSEMKLLREVFAPPPNPRDFSGGTSIDDFLKMLELAKTLVPKEGGSELAMLADIAKPLVGQLAARAAQQPVAMPAQPAGDPLGPLVENQGVGPSEFVALGSVLRVAMIADADPAPYAEMILDMLGDEQTAAMLEAPQWFEALCQFVPEAATRRPWCERLRAIVIQTLTEPVESDTTASDPKSAP